MALNRESLPVLFDRVYAAYMSRLKPLDKTGEAAPIVEEVTLDLDDAIEIED